MVNVIPDVFKLFYPTESFRVSNYTLIRLSYLNKMLRSAFTNLSSIITAKNIFRKHDAIGTILCRTFIRAEHDDSSVTKFFHPAPLKEYSGENIGMQLVGKLKTKDVLRVMNSFSAQKKISLLCKEYKIDGMN